MRKFELGGSMEALIPTVQFGNKTVFLHFKESLEGDYTDEQIAELQKQKYKQFCSEPLEYQVKEILVENIQRELKHLRLLKCPHCTKTHPSITTIRDFDSKGFYCTDDELKIAIALGCIQDIRCRHFVETGEWKEAKEIEFCWPYILDLKGTGKEADANLFSFPAFLKKYPLKELKNGERFFNCEWEITSEPDLFATPEGDWAENIPSVLDYKRNVDKLSAFTQMSVIAKNYGLKQMIAIPVNGETAQGFSKAVVSTDVDGYFEIAMDKRRKFRKRYGV